MKDHSQPVEMGSCLRLFWVLVRQLTMRGDERVREGVFGYLTLKHRVFVYYQLRGNDAPSDAYFSRWDSKFDKLSAASGHAPITPEGALRTLLLQAFYLICPERQFVEQPDYNLPFRSFVCLRMDGAVWNLAVCPKNRDCLLTSGVAQKPSRSLTAEPGAS